MIDGEQSEVLALLEIGPDGPLQALQQTLTHSKPHALEGMPDGRGIRVAFLSMHPISRQQTIQPLPPLIRPSESLDPVFTTLPPSLWSPSARPWGVERWRWRSIWMG